MSVKLFIILIILKFIILKDLFGNPISFDDNYRSLTVFSLPCVKVLDRESRLKEVFIVNALHLITTKL